MKTKIIGILVCMLVIATVFTIMNSVSACTGFTASDDDTVLVGNNEDWWHPDSYIRVYPPSEYSFGRVIFDVKFPLPGNQNYYSAFGGMNDQGLFFDIYSHPPLKPVNSSGKPYYSGGEIARYIMRACETVDDVLVEFNKYNLEFMENIQYFFADRTGNSVIIEGDEIIYREGDFQVVTNFLQSNPEHGWYPCWRYDTAVSMLENMTELSVNYFKDICNATHQEYYMYPTQYSNIFDLNEGIIYLYHFYNYENVVVLDLNEEFEQGSHSYYLPSLFEPLNNQPPNTPSRPNGRPLGKVGTEYTYKSSTTDPDNIPEELYYWFDWGDGTNSDWIKHQQTVGGKSSHTWTEQGNYEIKVKTRDIYGKESEWSDPLSVSMPKNKPYINTPFLRFLQNFFEKFPNAFPILRHLMGL